MIRTRHSSVFVHVGMLALLFAGLTGVGCQFVFGDFTLESGVGGAAVIGGTTSGGQTSVASAGGNSSGGNSVIVGASGGTGAAGGTTTLSTCDGSNSCFLCNVEETHCILDNAGAPTGSANVCNDTRSGWIATECPKGCKLGDAGTDTCLTCIEGDASCSTRTVKGVVTPVLRSCVANSWLPTDCANSCVDATSTAPAACQ